MCGIAVVVDLAPEAVDSVSNSPQVAERVDLGEAMLARLRHRGPDGSGRRLVGRTWLGHARLSIVDLTGGAQPLTDWAHPPVGPAARWLVANGEIYNHHELRDALGGPYGTQSDSEVIARVLDRLGVVGLRRMRGMFAFCLARGDGSVVLARDPLGVKPLYWARWENRLLAASELTAFPPEARSAVREFPPGHAWVLDADGERTVPFTDLHEQLHTQLQGQQNQQSQQGATTDWFRSRAEAREAIREALTAAVAERLMADVPVGVFLSGGLDSSLVAAIMARLTDGVRSFAAGTAGSADLAAARQVADHLGLEHHERVYDDDDVRRVLPEVVRSIESYEPSLVRSAVPNYLLAELTGRSTKVVLTGEGADELFAGYHHLRELDEDDFAAALIAGVEVLHNLNLQRCDRVTMAHGVEARVPFLSRDVLAVALRTPLRWKLLGADDQPRAQEKALLREAFEGWLPEDILWRRKEQFGDGSGTADVMSRLVDELVPDLSGPATVSDLPESTELPGLPAARSREELAYQRIFVEHLGGIDATAVLGRFAHA